MSEANISKESPKDVARTSLSGKYKIVLLGNQKVGKTSIIFRLNRDTFNDDYNVRTLLIQATAGLDFVTTIVKVDKENMQLQIWDTAGQEKFRSLTPSYVKSAKALVFVYDVSCKNCNNVIVTESIEGAEQWIKETLDVKQGDPKLFILANKIDLKDDRKVSEECGKALAAKYGADYFEASAKTGENILKVFTAIGKSLLENSTETKKDAEGISYTTQ